MAGASGLLIISNRIIADAPVEKEKKKI